MPEFLIDGSFFSFSSDWEVHKVDEWSEHARTTAEPFLAKSCDIAAFNGSALWLIEAKDYTYSGAVPPQDLVEAVGLKIFGTLALLHAVARWGEGERQNFCARAVAAKEAHVCLAIELPDGGRGLIAIQTPLAAYRDQLKKVVRKLGINRPVISNHLLNNGVPWTIRRDPATRSIHADR